MDRRERIIARIYALLVTLPGVGVAADGTPAVYRDRGEVPEGVKPAVIFLDGRGRLRTPVNRTNVQIMPPSIQSLNPQIFVLLEMRDNVLTNEQLSGQPAPVGPELSGWRNNVLALITQDDTLGALVGANGQISFDGETTDMETGSSMGVKGAELRFDFTLTYPLDPAQLNSP
jgi:hypothetical protein